MRTQKILADLRITIPREFADKHKLKEGDIVLVDETQSGLLVIPAEVKPRK